jgi:hypothetical protein
MSNHNQSPSLFGIHIKLPFSIWYLWMLDVALILITILQMYSISAQENRDFKWI